MSEDSAPPGKERMLAVACATLDEFMAAFNARDHERWAKCFHFPTVRLAGGEVLVWNTPDEFLRMIGREPAGTEDSSAPARGIVKMHDKVARAR